MGSNRISLQYKILFPIKNCAAVPHVSEKDLAINQRGTSSSI